MKYTEEEINIIKTKAFDYSILLWEKYSKLLSVDNLYLHGVEIPKDFFVKARNEIYEAEIKLDPTLADEIVKIAFKDFMEDVKAFIERTKIALGEVYYEDIYYDEED